MKSLVSSLHNKFRKTSEPCTDPPAKARIIKTEAFYDLSKSKQEIIDDLIRRTGLNAYDVTLRVVLVDHLPKSLADVRSIEDEIIVVRVDPVVCSMGDDDFRFVIAHELQHVVQFVTGRLSLISGVVCWDGRPKKEYWKDEYHMLPWEVDADKAGFRAINRSYDCISAALYRTYLSETASVYRMISSMIVGDVFSAQNMVDNSTNTMKTRSIQDTYV